MYIYIGFIHVMPYVDVFNSMHKCICRFCSSHGRYVIYIYVYIHIHIYI